LGRKNISQISKIEYEKEFKKFSNDKINVKKNITINDFPESKISAITQRS
jgi:hypothetical protein